MEEQPNLESDTTPPAPGELELVRAFLSLHDHPSGDQSSEAPSPATVAAWLEETGLLKTAEAASMEDLAWVTHVLEALRSKVFENMGAAPDSSAIARLDEAARRAGLSPAFESKTLVTSESGVVGAVGRVLAIAFLAQLDGSFARLRECGSPTCRSVFYDRSKNHSGRWCSMSECGNRAKVRAYRQRERAKR